MGAPPTVIAYIVWVAMPDDTENIMQGVTGQYLAKDKKFGDILKIDAQFATMFTTREAAEGAMLIDSTRHPARIGNYEIRAIVAGYAIRYQKVESEPVHAWGREEYTMNKTTVMYVGAGNSIVGSLDEAAKFRTKEKAEEISFNMALKDKSLLGAVEVVEIHHIQRS